MYSRLVIKLDDPKYECCSHLVVLLCKRPLVICNVAPREKNIDASMRLEILVYIRKELKRKIGADTDEEIAYILFSTSFRYLMIH